MPATYLVMNSAALKRVQWQQRRSRVVISASRLAHAERQRVQERINLLLGVSGYGLGLTALIAALVLCILWNGSHWQMFTAHWMQMTALCAATCFAVGGLGRATGFLYARWRLAAVIEVVAPHMEDCGAKAPGIGTRRTALMTRKSLKQWPAQ